MSKACQVGGLQLLNLCNQHLSEGCLQACVIRSCSAVLHLCYIGTVPLGWLLCASWPHATRRIMRDVRARKSVRYCRTAQKCHVMSAGVRTSFRSVCWCIRVGWLLQPCTVYLRARSMPSSRKRDASTALCSQTSRKCSCRLGICSLACWELLLCLCCKLCFSCDGMAALSG